MSNFGFGTPATTANTSFTGFGTPKLTTGFGLTGTAFGTPAPAASGSLTFGTPTATPATSAPAGNFSFGTTATATPQAQTGGLLANPGTTAATPSLFGTPAATSAAPLTGLGFGTLTSAATTGFGATPSATGFGATPGATATGFGTTPGTTATGFGATPGATVTGFGATPSAPATGGLSFGAPTTSAPLFGAAPTGGLFGAKPAATLAPVTTTTSVNKGLGGLDVSVSNKGLSQGSSSLTAAKENLIPNEITQTIDAFKEFVKTQKSLSSDIARGSARPLTRCAEDTASLMEILTTLAGSVQRDRSLVDKLKQDTAKALQSAEIAQRTHDTPPGLQYENNAPLLFFMELAETFEQDLMLFRSQIETTERHIQTMMTPRTLTPQELTMAMKKIHESLVAVAGKLQGVHAKVQQQKEQYLNLRKYILKDSTNVFEEMKPNGKTSRHSIGRVTSGPTPFGPGNKSFLSSTTINSGRQPSYGSANPLAWGNATPVPSATNMTMNATMKPPTASLNFNPPLNLTAPLSTSETSSSFQLQKPPVGNKRGKH
ncbi:probable nucleoporin Nup58 isoform X1 [Fopius arisanus]|uniref:Probable nucleoporin Nup58 isoform X1 n=1 Tax=Fopius arisanus TaxID=64838 RepID=A0A9R1TVE7_9HYME|nr:PREDICTED: probable nucleoporin Nup58 isoform X1 [Fopius arisanus]